MKAFVKVALLGSLLCSAAGMAQAQFDLGQVFKPKARSEVEPKVPKQAAQQPTPAQPQGTPQQPAENAIAKAAAQSGATKCSPRIGAFSNFLIGNAQAGAQLFVAPQEQNNRIVSTSLEVPNAAGGVAYVGASFAPDAASSNCGGVYEAVAYWQNTCTDVAKGAFGNFKPVGVIRQSIAVLEGGPTVKVYLMPAGNGCVSIKKEVAY